MMSGMSQSLGTQSDSTWIFGLKGSSEFRGLPEKKTLVKKSLQKRSKVEVGFLSGLRGVGINFRPRPMIVVRDFGIGVLTWVRSWRAVFDGREK